MKIKKATIKSCQIIIAVIFAMGLREARAELTINGATGLPLNPTAQLVPADRTPVQAAFHELGDDFSYYGVFAARRLGKRPIEISGGVSRLDNHRNKAGVAIGAKYLLREGDSPTALRVAVGAGYDHALGKNVHAYLVASKPMRTRSRLRPTFHLGARYDHFDEVGGEVGTDGDSSDQFSVYGGMEVPLTRSGKLSFAAEIQSRNHDFKGPRSTAPYSLALTYRPSDTLAVRGGVHRQGLKGENGLFISVSKLF